MGKIDAEKLDYKPIEKVVARIGADKRVPKHPVLHRLIVDMSSEAYHGSQGTWSSSQLKDIINDEEVFIQKYIRKTVPKVEREAFDTGTYFHTAVLEPHKISKEIAIFTGKVRHGQAWEQFRLVNEGKTIVTHKQVGEGDGMVKAVQNSPVSMEYLVGEPEISLFNEIIVSGGNIYAPYFGKVLTLDGWKDSPKKAPEGFKIILKVRADCLGDTFITDLKSTSGRANNKDSIRKSISMYMYDLSAALYLDMFSLMNEDVSAFVWVFASKQNPVAAPWLATEKQIRVGRAKWMWAIKRLADMSAANWEMADYLREAEPLPHELEWLQTRDTDLL